MNCAYICQTFVLLLIHFLPKEFFRYYANQLYEKFFTQQLGLAHEYLYKIVTKKPITLKNMTENFSLKALVGLSDVISYYWAKSIA